MLACTAQCSCMSGHGGTWIRSALYSQSLRSLLPMPSPPQRLLGVVLLGCLLYTPGIPNATEKRYLSCAPLSCIQFVPYGGASDAHPHPSEPLPKGNDTYNPSHSLGTRGNHIRLIVTTTLSVAGLPLGTHGRATTDSTGHTQRPIISTVILTAQRSDTYKLPRSALTEACQHKRAQKDQSSSQPPTPQTNPRHGRIPGASARKSSRPGASSPSTPPHAIRATSVSNQKKKKKSCALTSDGV